MLTNWTWDVRKREQFSERKVFCLSSWKDGVDRTVSPEPVQPVVEVGRPEVKFGMLSLRCPLDTQVYNGHVSLEFKGEVWVGDLNVGVINL